MIVRARWKVRGGAFLAYFIFSFLFSLFVFIVNVNEVQ